RTPTAVPGTMRYSTISLGKSNTPTRMAVKITRFATLSNIRAKNALASPARNQRYRLAIMCRSRGVPCARSAAVVVPLPQESSFAVVEKARVGYQLPPLVRLRVDLAGPALPVEILSRGVAPERVD